MLRQLNLYTFDILVTFNLVLLFVGREHTLSLETSFQCYLPKFAAVQNQILGGSYHGIMNAFLVRSCVTKAKFSKCIICSPLESTTTKTHISSKCIQVIWKLNSCPFLSLPNLSSLQFMLRVFLSQCTYCIFQGKH